MSQSDLEIVLKWRNHESIRRFMYTQHEIQMDEHSLWFKRVSVDPKQHLLIYQMDFKPLGFIRIQEISAGGIASWGFYAAPETPPGTGSALGYAALEYAFQKLKLHKLCGQAIAFNKRSIRFHMKIGFTKEGILKQQYFVQLMEWH